MSNEERNYNASYIYFRIQEEEWSLIPLLPGYIVFTTAGKNWFKLLILEMEKEFEEKSLESVIFMNISQYFSIPLSIPYSNCIDIIASNRTFYTKVLGFNVSCIIICHLCKTLMQYSNEDSRVKYSNLVTGAALAGRINRNSFQTVLATIGITNQCNEKSFYNYNIILRETLDNLESAHLLGQEKCWITKKDNNTPIEKETQYIQIDYWVSYSTRYALAVLDQNEGLDVMISKERSQKVFRIIMKFNSEMTNEARKEKFANGRKEFAGLTLISKTSDQIHKDIFWPSFGNILRDFDIIVKCVACYAFVKKSACNLITTRATYNGNANITLSFVTKNTFGFDNFQEGQKPSDRSNNCLFKCPFKALMND
ncbi:hypothetical protein GLOIN_2v1767711 [Rhizophagus irregularis DAOM 181602=DAOM 197198]|uniref:Uncharacterized protein n=1 Tax=Rhizophagus irregularis (strain DAOM 181602 / DAOM 197198 / MUCL 43194) TaxID=747089 RepID=A0A2P4QIE3_RHIID|nr:hypothetical protein GLOIN_2v1767711 [Rhizophagus irregularis DAOM 181602=DAOM 197198]POG77411.1 hypothetical protein GLOIN_2v1767711 [Rhizophagus irregularis DAOM 181602=DAOM 197198]|eukprot:XP_025184277.1 hypothetical protein GLOIN_2v1767711 [Rhizophagus irregularis DAOM 181602=DAOM 197198]